MEEKPKKIKAIIIFGFPLGIGGHFKSSLAFIKGLRSLGFEFYLVIPNNSNSFILNEFRSLCYNIYEIGEIGYSKHCMRSLIKNKLLDICRSNEIEMMFAQDFVAMVSALKVSIILEKTLFYTKAGGPLNQYFPPKSIPTIVYSKELHEGLIRKFKIPVKNIAYIAERIDCDLYNKVEEVDKSIISGYKIPLNSYYKIFIAVRFERAKMSYIKAIFQTINENQNFFEGTNLIIAGDGSLKHEIIDLIRNTNKTFGLQFVHYIGEVVNSRHLVNIYNYVDIVIGSGRGILEPMACGVNVILAGDNSIALEVDENNFDKIKYWNCSIRALEDVKNTSTLLDVLLKQKSSKIDNSERLRKLVLNNYDAKLGVSKLFNFILQHKDTQCNYLKFFWWLVKYYKNLSANRFCHVKGYL